MLDEFELDWVLICMGVDVLKKMYNYFNEIGF